MTEVETILAVTREQKERARSYYIPNAFKFMRGAVTVYFSPKFMCLLWDCIRNTPPRDGEVGV